MVETEVVWLPVGFRASYRPKGTRVDRTGTFSKVVPLTVPRIDPDDAPVAFELTKDFGTVRWRSVDGVLMREITRPPGRTADVVPGVVTTDFVRDGGIRDVGTRDGGAWRDYPFIVPFRWEDGPTAVDAEEFEGRGGFGRWVSDDKEKRLASAAAVAATWRICDGALLKPSLPPVLSVRQDFHGRVSRLVTEYAIHGLGLDVEGVHFPHDRPDLARDYVDRHAPFAAEAATTYGRPPPAPPTEDLGGFLEGPASAGLAADAGDPELSRSCIEALRLNVSFGVGLARACDLDPRMLIAYGTLGLVDGCASEDLPKVLAAARELSEAVLRGDEWCAPCVQANVRDSAAALVDRSRTLEEDLAPEDGAALGAVSP